MAWHGILGHDDVVEQFRRALGRGRLASSFLFAGPEGVGKRTFALKLAQALLCGTRPEEAMDPCRQCPSCLQVQAQTHPDLYVVSKPPDKSFLPLELLIGDKEHRMRQGLCHSIGLKPFLGRRKVAIIDDADFLNPEGANCLLKTLEEPPPRSVLILITTSPAKQLPTIRSRCQLIRFQGLAEDQLAELLVGRQLVGNREEARRLAALSEGGLHRAIELAERPLWEFRSALYVQLAGPHPDSIRLAQAAWSLVQEAGSEASARRARLRRVIQLAADFYRQLLRHTAGMGVAGDEALGRAVQRAGEWWQAGQLGAAACLDRCLEAVDQLDRNTNQAAVLECWLTELADIHGRPAPVYRERVG